MSPRATSFASLKTSDLLLSLDALAEVAWNRLLKPLTNLLKFWALATLMAFATVALFGSNLRLVLDSCVHTSALGWSSFLTKEPMPLFSGAPDLSAAL